MCLFRKVQEWLNITTHTWPPGSNPVTRTPEKHMHEEWLAFNSTHHFPAELEGFGHPIPDNLAKDIAHIVQSVDPRKSIRDLKKGWVHFDSLRGFDYRLVFSSGEDFSAVRELSHFPVTLPTPPKQEIGVINLVVPVHSLTDTESLKSFIVKLSQFNAQATDEVKKAKGISLHLPMLEASESVSGSKYTKTLREKV